MKQNILVEKIIQQLVVHGEELYLEFQVTRSPEVLKQIEDIITTVKQLMNGESVPMAEIIRLMNGTTRMKTYLTQEEPKKSNLH